MSCPRKLGLTRISHPSYGSWKTPMSILKKNVTLSPEAHVGRTREACPPNEEAGILSEPFRPRCHHFTHTFGGQPHGSPPYILCDVW
jgi:hypothetical protein